MPIIRIKRGTTTQWTNSTSPLSSGELGYDTTSKVIKIGDGTTLWNSLLPLNKFEIDEISQDAIYSALTNFIGTGNNITVEYNDEGNYIVLDVGPDVVLQSDLIQAVLDQIGQLTTDSLEEGTVNVYWTESRTKEAAAELLVNSTQSNISITGNGAGLTISAQGGLAGSTTDNLTEGSTNLYFTDQRALDATVLAYDILGSASIAESNAIASSNEYTDIAISGLGNQIGEDYIPISLLGNVDGVAQLDSNGLVPDNQIPSTIARDSELFSGSYNDLTDKPSIALGAVQWTANHYQLEGGANTRYLAGDIVWDAGNIYVANFDNESLPTTNTQYWSLIGAGNRLNIDGRDIPNILWDNILQKPTFFDGNYDSLTNKPTLFSGSYNDLTEKPVLFDGSYLSLTDTPLLFSGSYNDLTNLPTLFSGSYNDLADKPTLFDGSYLSLTNLPTLFSGSYNDLTNKPNIPDLTGYATEIYVDTAVSNLIDAAPAALDTLNELAAALGDDANYATTITNALSLKAPLASPTFTGEINLNGTTPSYLEIAYSDNTGSLYLDNTGIYLDTYTDVGNDFAGIATEQGIISIYTNYGDMYFDNLGLQILNNGSDSVQRLGVYGNTINPLTVTGNTTTFAGTVDFTNATVTGLSGGGGSSAATPTVRGLVYGYMNDISDPNAVYTALGYNALVSRTSGGYQVALGARAAKNLTTGSDVTAVGDNALYSSTTGFQNTALGTAAGSDLSTGSQNVFIGNSSGRGILTGTKNTYIGSLAGLTVQNPTATNNILIGYDVNPSSTGTSNEITLGNSNITKFRVPGIGIDWSSETAPASKTEPSVDYYITNNGAGSYTVNGVANGSIEFIKGKKYRIHINASGHPFWIQTVSGGYSSGNVYSTGITGNGTQVGHIIVELPQNAPDNLYYACQFHSSMAGAILVRTEDISFNAQSSNYTITTSDSERFIEMSGGGTLTISDSSAFPIGFTCDVLQTGSSQVTIAGNGFTPNATPGLKLRTQWSSATLIKRALNSWVVIGDLSA